MVHYGSIMAAMLQGWGREAGKLPSKDLGVNLQPAKHELEGCSSGQEGKLHPSLCSMARKTREVTVSLYSGLVRTLSTGLSFGTLTLRRTSRCWNMSREVGEGSGKQVL